MAAVCAAFAGFAGPAAAAPRSAIDRPMTFVEVRDGIAACGGHCPRWIAAQGRIDAGAGWRFALFLRAHPRLRAPVLVNSPGGSVQDAIAIGRAIRARGLSVAVARTAFIDCAGRCAPGERLGMPVALGAYCASACPLILAGGLQRAVGPWAFVGVHQMIEIATRVLVRREYLVRYRIVNGRKVEVSRKLMSVTRGKPMTHTGVAGLAFDRLVGAYLAQMGVGPGVLKAAMTTPNSGVHWFGAAELRSTRLANTRADGTRMKVLPDGSTAFE